MRYEILFLVMLVPAYCQIFSFGVKGGGVATDGLDPYAQNAWEGKRYIFGPAVEMRLPFRLAAEVDVLYRRAGDRNASCFFGSCFDSRVRASILEFPVLVKYRLLRRPLAAAPYVSGGLSIEWVRHGSGNFVGTVMNPVVLGAPTLFESGGYSRPAEKHVGGVVAGGVEFRAGRLRLSPEFRYMRWDARYWEANGSHGYFSGSNLNQAEILFGLTF